MFVLGLLSLLQLQMPKKSGFSGDRILKRSCPWKKAILSGAVTLFV